MSSIAAVLPRLCVGCGGQIDGPPAVRDGRRYHARCLNRQARVERGLDAPLEPWALREYWARLDDSGPADDEATAVVPAPASEPPKPTVPRHRARLDASEPEWRPVPGLAGYEIGRDTRQVRSYRGFNGRPIAEPRPVGTSGNGFRFAAGSAGPGKAAGWISVNDAHARAFPELAGTGSRKGARRA